MRAKSLPGRLRRPRAKLATAGLAALLLGSLGGWRADVRAAAQQASRAFDVALPVPSPGDVSYGVAEVRIASGRHSMAVPPAGDGQLVFNQSIGALAVSARSTRWRTLSPTTRAYVVVSRVAGKPAALRDVAFFILRRRIGSGPQPSVGGTVVFSISNADAAPGSFWVRGTDARGYARIFQVRNILSTALANWGRYLHVLQAAHALTAAMRPLEVSAAPAGAARTGPRARAKAVWTGGQRPSPGVRRLFRLLVNSLGTPAAYAAAKKDPLVAQFIARELGNRQLSRRWRDVAGQLPLEVPDRYAAAAQEEAKFTAVAAPRISATGVPDRRRRQLEQSDGGCRRVRCPEHRPAKGRHVRFWFRTGLRAA
jgi:hypothetical protein